MSSENWRKSNTTLGSRLKVILRRNLFTDAVFVVEGKEFSCHRLILAIGSPYFERTFYHPFESSGPTTMYVSDVTPDAFQCVLNYLYTDKITFGSADQAFATYKAAEKFEISNLKSECEIYVCELEFYPKTVWRLLEQALFHKMQRLARKTMTYIQSNTYECIQDDSFLSTTEEIVVTVLKSDKLTSPEIELLHHLISWIKHKKGITNANNYLLKKYVPAFLRFIRFKGMTPKEMVSFTTLYPDLIDHKDSLVILQHLEFPNRTPLPSWCSSLTRRTSV